jgi:single-stranded DNA-binding protein
MASKPVRTIVGRVGRKPEKTETPTGKTVAGFSVAENVWDPDAKEEITRWYQISAWAEDADVAVENLDVGMRVYVRGRYSEFEGTKGTVYQLDVDEFGAADRFRPAEGAGW